MSHRRNSAYGLIRSMRKIRKDYEKRNKESQSQNAIPVRPTKVDKKKLPDVKQNRLIEEKIEEKD